MNDAQTEFQPELTIGEMNHKEDVEKYVDFDKIIVDVKDNKNIISLARSEKHYYDLYIGLLSNDYMFYMHKGEKSYFIKRNQLSTIWQRKDLIQHGDLFYSIEDIAKERVNQMAPNRLVVIFSSMPSETDYFSPNIGARCFTKNFPTLARHLIKGTRVMRIMDANLSHGSHYINTPNYPTFEADVQGAIKEVIQRYTINKEDVVLYGTSKGGTGALYHGLLGNYKTVCVDPILSLKEYNELMMDAHFLKNFRDENLANAFLAIEQPAPYKKIVLESPYVPYNYKFYAQFASDKNVEVFNVFDNNIKNHMEVFLNSIVEQVTFINNQLLDSKNFRKMNEDLYKVVTENYSSFT